MTISKNFHRSPARLQEVRVRVNLTTNGTPNERSVDRRPRRRVGRRRPVDGRHGRGVREDPGGFPWRRFVANIEKLVQAKRDAGKTFRIEWRYCAHSDSIHQLPDMIRVAKRLGVDRIQVMPCPRAVRREPEIQEPDRSRSLANEYFKLARSVAKRTGDAGLDSRRRTLPGTSLRSALKIQSRVGSRGSAGSRFVDRDGQLFQTLQA